MQRLDKIKEVKVGEQEVEIDPRSKSTAVGAPNYIAKPEVVGVRGRNRMLAEKKKTAIVV